jgi:hypothetical protein
VLIQSRTHGSNRAELTEERQTLAASDDQALDASGAPKKCPVKGLITIFICGAINTCGGRPWLVAEHTVVLVAYVVALGSPLTHSYLIVSIGSSERAILVRLHCDIASSGIRCSCCKPVVLVTLRGFHLLDGLVAYGSIEAHKKIV